MGKSPGLKLHAAIVQDNVPVEVTPRLFVGSIHAAFNVDTLKQQGITHILNLAGSDATFPDDFTYLSISIRDKDNANLLSCLPLAMIFLDAVLTQPNGSGVLVHCAGGRSRSPALAISYLMTRGHMSFDDALAHMRVLRPVVALNAGFEAQLRCLDSTHGDVFAAHQLILQQRLAALSIQHEQGQLSINRDDPAKRRHSHQPHRSREPIPNTPPTSPPVTPRSMSMPTPTTPRSVRHSFPGCDERGMLHGCVPSGFRLSLPPDSHTPMSIPDVAGPPYFIPALRCMGTMLGCRACGESLFCASSILARPECTTTEALMTERTSDNDTNEGSDPTASASVAQIQKGTTRKTLTTKSRPLLAKLRLPQYTGSMRGSKSKILNPAAENEAARSSVPSERGSVIKVTQVDSGKRVIDKTRRGSDSGRSNASDRGSGYDSSVADGTGSGNDRESASTLRKDGRSRRQDGFWRTLSSLASAKRAVKDAVDKKRVVVHSTGTSNPPSLSSQFGATEDRDKKRLALSPKGIELSLHGADMDNEGSCDVEESHMQFLRENAQQWERGLRQIEETCGASKRCTVGTDRVNKPISSPGIDPSNTVARATCTEQVTALARWDRQALVALSSTPSWFVAPQSWLINNSADTITGTIVCPRNGCGAVLGQWHWGGLARKCEGGSPKNENEDGPSTTPIIRPAFRLEKHALRVLGNITAPPEQARHLAKKQGGAHDVSEGTGGGHGATGRCHGHGYSHSHNRGHQHERFGPHRMPFGDEVH